MGCDIHAYIEYEYSYCPKCWVEQALSAFESLDQMIEFSLNYLKPALPPDHAKQVTRQFAHPHFDREYSLFGLMASGLRDDRLSGYPLRGLPEHASSDTLHDYSLRVDDRWAGKNGYEHYCSCEEAKRWTTPHASSIPGVTWAPESVWLNDDHTLISNPDWHSASWLTADEFETCLQKFNATYQQKVEDNCWGILGAMRALEAHGNTVRLVFWFDN